MTRPSLTVLAGGLAVMLAASSASGQGSTARGTSAPVSQSTLESIARLDCRFEAVASGVWPGGVSTVHTTARARPLTFTMTDIDVVDGTATIRAGGRVSSLSARSDRSNLYFFQVDPDGTAMLTTVFSQQTRPGWLKAVHTRSGRSPEQDYGECAPR